VFGLKPGEMVVDIEDAYGNTSGVAKLAQIYLKDCFSIFESQISLTKLISR